MKFHATMMKFRARIKIKFHAAIKMKFHVTIRRNFTLRSKWNFRAWFDRIKGMFPFSKKMPVLIQIQERAGSIIHEHLNSMILNPKSHIDSSWSCDPQRWTRLYRLRNPHFRKISIPPKWFDICICDQKCSPHRNYTNNFHRCDFSRIFSWHQKTFINPKSISTIRINIWKSNALFDRKRNTNFSKIHHFSFLCCLTYWHVDVWLYELLFFPRRHFQSRVIARSGFGQKTRP